MFRYKTVTVEILQKMQELAGVDLVCDGDEQAVVLTQRCEAADAAPTN